MSASKSITENVLGTLSKGPLVIFLAFGVALWQASFLTPEQIATLEKLTMVLNNPVGAAVYFAMGLLLTYAVVLHPTAKFLATILTEFIQHQKSYAIQHNIHVEASKDMYHRLETINEKCKIISDKIDEFYGGKS